MDSQQSESLLSPIIVYALASFVGNLGVTITGLGMAIIFIFVYTIADLFQVLSCSICGLTDAVFIQALALASAMPLMIFKARHIIKSDWNKELLLTFIPATIASTPVGKIVQSYVPSDLLRAIVGGFIICIVCYEFTKVLPVAKCCNMNKMSPIKKQDKKDTHHDDHLDCENKDSFDHEGQISFPIKCDSSPPIELNEQAKLSVEPVHETTTVQKDNDNGNETAQHGSQQQVSSPETPSGWRLRIWGFICGCLSGFLGGLMGVQGPPLMIFFLIFSFPKNVVRANALIILLVNVSVRIVSYIIEDVSATQGNWFDSSYTNVYISAMLFGMLGVPVGDYVATKLNQQQFKLVITFLLLFSGVSNLVKGSINLATSA